MITDLRTSINSILYQRVTSPLFGTFIVAWLIWNWKIFYTTFIIDSDKIEKTRIDYIVENYNDPWNLIWFPLISTILLITIVPFISNGAYWLSLKFEQWRVDNKHKIERKQLLTLEQSIQLREQILDYEKKFESILKEKDDEIEQLKLLIEKSSENQEGIKPGSQNDEKDVVKLFNIIKDDEQRKNDLYHINEQLQSGSARLASHEFLNTPAISFFESNEIIENIGGGNFKLTKKGKRLNKLINDLEYSKN